MYLDRTRNWDYNPLATNPANGSLHADHGELSRAEAILRGVPIPLPNRLTHGRCNAQRGIGGNDHLAPVVLAGNGAGQGRLGNLLMEWPW
jgi:hypothetical protein